MTSSGGGVMSRGTWRGDEFRVYITGQNRLTILSMYSTMSLPIYITFEYNIVCKITGIQRLNCNGKVNLRMVCLPMSMELQVDFIKRTM